MPAKYVLCNAFSLNMLSDMEPTDATMLGILRIDATSARDLLLECGYESAVGHPGTANLLCTMLGLEVACVRSTVAIPSGGAVIVAQYVGPRLPEGATSLPDGARIDWFEIRRK